MRIAKLYVFGNRKTCPLCCALSNPRPAKGKTKTQTSGIFETAVFKAWLVSHGVEVIDCDQSDRDPAVVGNYAKYGKMVGDKPGSIPRIHVFSDEGKKLGWFLARGYTTASLLAKFEKMCPGCCDDGSCEDAPAKMKQCPTCKGKGEVPA